MTPNATSNEIEIALSIRNTRSKPVSVHLEPWAEEYVMPQNAQLLFVGNGPVTGSGFGIEYADDGIFVLAWDGSTVRVFDGDMELGTVEHRPPVPILDYQSTPDVSKTEKTPRVRIG
jgi:hypothetical protein